MPDVHDTATRSRNMAAIKAKNTKPELIIRKMLHKQGFRYRIHDKSLPGKPDLVFPKYKAVIFVHGCFWHGHNCHLFKVPESRTDFWLKKIGQNKQNDLKVIKLLHERGLRILNIWECALKGKNRLDIEILAQSVSYWLSSTSPELTIKGKEAA